jgi:hypothetical protein
MAERSDYDPFDIPQARNEVVDGCRSSGSLPGLFLAILLGSILVSGFAWIVSQRRGVRPVGQTSLPSSIPASPFPTPGFTLQPTSRLVSSPTTVTAEPLIRLLFTGDINPGRCPAQAALRYQDFTLPYHFVAEELRSADISVGSLDGTLSDLSPPEICPEVYVDIVNLIGPARSVEGLAYAGFDVLTLATNHIMDCGSLGWRCGGRVLDETRRNLLAAGILPVGAGADLTEARQPVVVERQGVRFAFLGVNAVSGGETWAGESQPGAAPLSEAAMSEVEADIAAARRQAEVVIVLPHWGLEFEQVPTEIQIAWAARMVAAGADLIIGNHPHVIQPMQTFPGGQVAAYALGNFVFDQGTQTQEGLVFEAVFSGSRLVRWQLLPVKGNALYQPQWVDAADSEALRSGIEAAGNALFGH